MNPQFTQNDLYSNQRGIETCGRIAGNWFQTASFTRTSVELKLETDTETETETEPLLEPAWN